MKTKYILYAIAVVVLGLGLVFPRSGGTVVERIVGASPGPERYNPCESRDGKAGIQFY